MGVLLVGFTGMLVHSAWRKSKTTKMSRLSDVENSKNADPLINNLAAASELLSRSKMTTSCKISDVISFKEDGLNEIRIKLL
jgi:hypothetical protein